MVISVGILKDCGTFFVSTDNDYSPLNATEEFSADNQDELMCFNLTIIDDSIVESSEVVVILLTSDDLSVTVPANGSQSTVTIMDNFNDGQFLVIIPTSHVY